MLTSEDTGLFDQAAIAFDLDGTLVDTAPDLVRALNAVTRPFGLQPVPLDDVRAMVGRGALALMQRAFEREGRVLEDPETRVKDFIEIYGQQVAVDSRIFPDVEATLDWLAAHGASLSVCTNKPSVLSDMILDELGLTRHFARIIGPERTTAKKPAPDHVHDALGSGHARGALVGDSAPDVDAAAAAGVPSVILSYGYSEKPAGSLGAGRVVHAFRDVPRALAELWRAQV